MSGRALLRAAVVFMAAAFPLAVGLAVRIGDGFAAAWVLAFVAYGVAGVLILWNRPGNRIGRLFLLLGLVAPLAEIAAAYAVLDLPGGAWAGWASQLAFPVTFGALLVFLPLLFPTGTFLSPRWRAFGAVAAFELLLVAVLFALAPGSLDCCPGIRSPVRIPGLEGLRGIVAGGFPLVAATSLVSFVSLALRYRRSRGEERLQLRWFTLAVGWIVLTAIGGGLNAVGILPDSGVLPLVLYPSGTIAIAAAVGIAILRYRLYDIDVVINKTLVYAALAAFITMVYVGVVVGLGNLLGTRGEPNLPLQVAATALVAVAFQPVRARVQRLANRLVYGERATPYEVMTDFAARMSGVIEIDEVLPRLAEAAARGVGGVRGRVVLFLSDGSSRTATWPPGSEEVPDDLVLPAEHAGERVGEIAVTKAPGDSFRVNEEALLRHLAAQTGVALHNVRLAADLRDRLDEIARQANELRRSRARLVTAADDERRRLERTIELGPQRKLGAMAGALREALARLDAGVEAVVPVLADLRDEAQATLEEVRDLARGIYPPLLAEVGLAAALEAQAGKVPFPVDVHPNGVGRYPQEIEAAIYFCVLEALQNAAKYADPTRAAVSLRRENGDVAFEVSDDGRGFDPSRTTKGSGLQNMADRIEALGGRLEVRSAPAAGTTIAGRIPIRPAEARQ